MLFTNNLIQTNTIINMKKLQLLLRITIYIIVLMFISSCSLIKNDDFSQQKYSKIKKVEASVNLNRMTKEKKNDDQICIVPEKKIEELAIIPADEPCQDIATIIPEAKNNTGKTIRKVNFIQKEIKKVILSRAVSIVKSQNLKKTSTVSYADNDHLLLLVILAILLPPLSVYLARGIGNSFWIDLILTCLFWIPGVIFALVVAFNVR